MTNHVDVQATPSSTSLLLSVFGSETLEVTREWGWWLERYGSIKHKGHFGRKRKLISQQPECAVTFTNLHRSFLLILWGLSCIFGYCLVQTSPTVGPSAFHSTLVNTMDSLAHGRAHLASLWECEWVATDIKGLFFFFLLLIYIPLHGLT